MTTEQSTFTGETVNDNRLTTGSRSPIGYWLYCAECDEYLARHERHGHNHRLYPAGHKRHRSVDTLDRYPRDTEASDE